MMDLQNTSTLPQDSKMSYFAKLIRSIDELISTNRRRHSRRFFYTSSVIAILGSTSTGIFLDIAGDVRVKEVFAWDMPVMLASKQMHTPILDSIMKAVTMAGSHGATLVTTATALWFLRRKSQPELTALLTSVIGAATINGLLKLVFARPRPSVFPPLTVEHTYSFPSGHTITAVALYGFLATLLWQRQHRALALLVGAVIPAVGFSRIYLGVHYPSDVVAAMMLGSLWLMLVMVGLSWHHSLAGQAKAHEMA